MNDRDSKLLWEAYVSEARDNPDWNPATNPQGKPAVDPTKTSNLASSKLNWVKAQSQNQRRSQGPAKSVLRHHARPEAAYRDKDQYVVDYIRDNAENFKTPQGGFDSSYIVLFLINAGYNSVPEIDNLANRTKGLGGAIPSFRGGRASAMRSWLQIVFHELRDEGVIEKVGTGSGTSWKVYGT